MKPEVDTSPRSGKASLRRDYQPAGDHRHSPERTVDAWQGALVQVELDALALNLLRILFEAALVEFWDESAYLRSLDQEKADPDELFAVSGR